MKVEGSPAGSPVAVGRMSQLAELRDDEDDWTGVTNSADRRRRQNRLNQRAYRRRLQAQAQAQTHVVLREQSALCPWDSDTSLMIEDPRTRAIVYAFGQLAYMQYMMKTPRLSYLPALIRLNAHNAIYHNACLLGFPIKGMCNDDLLSPFNALGPAQPLERTAWESSPENLHPTDIQRSLKHHPWADLLPLPRLRDNILIASENGTIDEDDLCCDLMEVSRDASKVDAHLIVWGESWNVEMWEASEGFLRKWGGLLKGCTELIDATNRWREKRGERKIVIRV